MATRPPRSGELRSGGPSVEEPSAIRKFFSFIMQPLTGRTRSDADEAEGSEAAATVEEAVLRGFLEDHDRLLPEAEDLPLAGEWVLPEILAQPASHGEVYSGVRTDLFAPPSAERPETERNLDPERLRDDLDHGAEDTPAVPGSVGESQGPDGAEPLPEGPETAPETPADDVDPPSPGEPGSDSGALPHAPSPQAPGDSEPDGGSEGVPGPPSDPVPQPPPADQESGPGPIFPSPPADGDPPPSMPEDSDAGLPDDPIAEPPAPPRRAS